MSTRLAFRIRNKKSSAVGSWINQLLLFWCRGALRRPLQPQRWLHRGLQLQGEVRLWLIGHLPLQSGLHSLGQWLEVVFRGWRVEWCAASMQAYHLRSASRGQEWTLPLDERHIDCLEEPGSLFMSFRSSNAFRSKWVISSFFLQYLKL